MTTRHVIVGVDGSLIAVRALDRAAEEALLRGAPLDIVYAVSDPDEAGPVLASAAARVRERHPGLPVTASAFQGGPVQALARHGQDAALTVIGTRGLGGLAGLLFGSVSLRLAARTRGPLLVVRGNYRAAGRSEVLLGLEDEADMDAAAFAFAEAQRRGLRLRVVHAGPRYRPAPSLPAPVTADRVRDGAGPQAQTEPSPPCRAVTGSREQCPGVAVQARTVGSNRMRALLEATRDAAVVVVGSGSHSHRIGPWPGPLAAFLLHHSHCPVTVV
ncbi:universal stress protein [Streptomyces sp. NBC_01689]|uniref:universal stress protein n=1 Tax=Streptomyces sp. NBC_01689 TaxID=2975911 RepID=UPI002E3250A0|nr:universal stress protein [Streptomyces sp. NBC_01689]